VAHITWLHTLPWVSISTAVERDTVEVLRSLEPGQGRGIRNPKQRWLGFVLWSQELRGSYCSLGIGHLRQPWCLSIYFAHRLVFTPGTVHS
jgi:hypothetical protein